MVCSAEELQRLLTDPSAYKAFLSSIESVKHAEKVGCNRLLEHSRMRNADPSTFLPRCLHLTDCASFLLDFDAFFISFCVTLCVRADWSLRTAPDPHRFPFTTANSYRCVPRVVSFVLISLHMFSSFTYFLLRISF